MLANKKSFILPAAILLAVIIIAGIVVEIKKSNKELAIEVKGKQAIEDFIPVWLRTNKDVINIQSQMDEVVSYQAKYGCVDSAPNQSADCQHYSQRMDDLRQQLFALIDGLQVKYKNPDAIAKAIANIKDLREDQSLQIEFTRVIDNPYSSKGRNADVYDDNKGMGYMVDSATNQVTQFGPAPIHTQNAAPVEFAQAPKLTNAQRKQKALDYLTAHVTGFDQVQKDFIYSVIIAPDGVSAYRWQSKIKTPGEDMTAFVQVVMSPAGEPESFNDTRNIYN